MGEAKRRKKLDPNYGTGKSESMTLVNSDPLVPETIQGTRECLLRATWLEQQKGIPSVVGNVFFWDTEIELYDSTYSHHAWNASENTIYDSFTVLSQVLSLPANAGTWKGSNVQPFKGLPPVENMKVIQLPTAIARTIPGNIGQLTRYRERTQADAIYIPNVMRLPYANAPMEYRPNLKTESLDDLDRELYQRCPVVIKV